MGIVSYAQNFEDVMLLRALKNIKNGFYIDVGANDPIEHSVTKSMYDLGWKGINCEPVSHWFEKLQKNRVRDINLQIAIGSDNEELEFYEVVNTGLSTFNKEIANQHAKKLGFTVKNYMVPVKTLTNICEENNIETIHFLKIDVEGAEKIVLEGIDFKNIRPWIILVEATKPMSQYVNYDEWEELITSEKYHFVYFDGLNRFYIANEHTELDCYFENPPNVFDDFKLSSYINIEKKLVETESRLEQTGVRLIETESRLEQTSVRLIETESRLEQTGVRLIETESRLEQTGVRLIETKSRLEQTGVRLIETESRLEQTSINLNNVSMKLKLLVNSLSWKVTRPLRLLKYLIGGK